ncbi:MAG: hypothetical protein GQ527_01840, partial [Bacteroidales bacterium]|nr:hypothetical protein [Bacteroidales bacterium]
WYFYDKNDEPETFTAHISSVNRKEKAFVGGKKTSIMELANVFPYKLTFEITTHNKASENGLEIFNEDGDAYFISGELENDSLYHFDVNLIPGCYEMILYDEAGDGISSPEGSTIFLRIKNQKNGIVLKEFGSDFGSEIREQFMIFR